VVRFLNRKINECGQMDKITSEDLSMDDEKIIITLATDEKIACNLSLEEFSQISKHEIIDGVNGVDQDTNGDTLGDFEPI